MSDPEQEDRGMDPRSLEDKYDRLQYNYQHPVHTKAEWEKTRTQGEAPVRYWYWVYLQSN